jgi:hypothetical protein
MDWLLTSMLIILVLDILLILAGVLIRRHYPGWWEKHVAAPVPEKWPERRISTSDSKSPDDEDP